MTDERSFFTALEEADPANGQAPPSPQHEAVTPNGTGRQRFFTESPGDTKLRAVDLVAPRRIPPSRGWRAVIYRLSWKSINLGESPDERYVRALITDITAKVRNPYTVAVLGGKGGAGKTSMTALVASMFAHIRNDQVVAIDADQAQMANLAARVNQKANSLREVNTDAAAHKLGRYADMQDNAGQNEAGLDVVAAVRHVDSCAPRATGEEFAKAHHHMQNFYTVLFVDCGVDLDHPVMQGVLACADTVLMVASTGPDGADGADTNFRWLHTRGYGELLRRAVLVVNHNRDTTSRKDRGTTTRLIEAMYEHFGQLIPRERIIEMPYDPHIATAGVVNLDELRPLVHRRALEIAAAVARGFTTTTENR